MRGVRAHPRIEPPSFSPTKLPRVVLPRVWFVLVHLSVTTAAFVVLVPFLPNPNPPTSGVVERSSVETTTSISEMSPPAPAPARSQHQHRHRPETTERVVRHESPFASEEDVDVDTVLIVLNRPVTVSSRRRRRDGRVRDDDDDDDDDAPVARSLFERLWERSCHRICADGGANRLYDETVGRRRHDDDGPSMVPDLVVGDLDSVRDDVRDHYERRGCRVVRDPDQDSNDLDKAVRAARDELRRRRRRRREEETTTDGRRRRTNRVCVYGAFGGRFDQSMASAQALHRWTTDPTNNGDDDDDDDDDLVVDLVLCTEETSARLLRPGASHEIRIDQAHEGPCCGLLPVGARCDRAITEGLRWNLDGPTEFGGLVSTSNIVENDVVRVTCTHPLVWTTELRGFGNGGGD